MHLKYIEALFTDSPNRDVCLVKLSKRKTRGREETIPTNLTNKERKVSPRHQGVCELGGLKPHLQYSYIRAQSGECALAGMSAIRQIFLSSYVRY